MCVGFTSHALSQSAGQEKGCSYSSLCQKKGKNAVERFVDGLSPLSDLYDTQITSEEYVIGKGLIRSNQLIHVILILDSEVHTANIIEWP